MIGAGLGGATLGYELAKRGHAVIFLERGRLQDAAPGHSSGTRPDDGPLSEGWWPADLSHHDGSSVRTFRHPLGCGSGGSSAIFGMVMERFRPDDFNPGRFVERNGSTVPDAWPIQYADLHEHYGVAERLYRVRGTPDPLFPEAADCWEPPPATNKERLLLEAFSDCGLHPYRFHYACERVSGCEGCPGTICRRACRNDAHRACVVPALQEHGASLLAECRVHHLECSGRTVSEAVAVHRGSEIRIRARVFVLAANAFSSPLILLRSRSERFPNGLANSSGMVGRNLMLHVSDSLLVKRQGLSRSRLTPLQGPMNHGIGINDFYTIDGVKHGNIHAHPTSVSAQNIMAYLTIRYPQRVRQFPAVARLAAQAAAVIHAEKTYFATIVDDLPYAENRVLPDASSDDRMSYAYTVHDELRRRAENLVRQFALAVKGRCGIRVIGGYGQLNRSHACGTIRFGDDPRTSVLDAVNRAHDVDNLYAVDASFFPSSGGVNPGLTIAANALRVAPAVSASV